MKQIFPVGKQVITLSVATTNMDALVANQDCIFRLHTCSGQRIGDFWQSEIMLIPDDGHRDLGKHD